MKKKLSVFLLMIFPIFLISACSGKQTDPETFGKEFFEALIYGKKSENLENEISVKDLHKSSEDLVASMKDGFQTGASSVGASITEEQAQKLADDFMKQVNKKTRFKIVEAKTEKDTMKITYEITGIDYINFMKDLLQQSIDFEKNNPSAMDDMEAMTDKMVDMFDQAILSVKVTEKPIKIPVTFIKNSEGKWGTKDANAVVNLTLATLCGQKNEQELSDHLMKTMEEFQQNASENQTGENE